MSEAGAGGRPGLRMLTRGGRPGAAAAGVGRLWRTPGPAAAPRKDRPGTGSHDHPADIRDTRRRRAHAADAPPSCWRSLSACGSLTSATPASSSRPATSGSCIDPGTFSPGFQDLTDLDAILVTHQHADHVDVQRLPALLDANPEARLLVEPQTAEQLVAADLAAQHLTAGETTHVGAVELTAVGQRHAVINEFIPRIDNLGVVLRADGRADVLPPGDAYDAEPGDVDVLALPLNAPWAAARDTIAFVRRIAPGSPYRSTTPCSASSDAGSTSRRSSNFGPDGMDAAATCPAAHRPTC